MERAPERSFSLIRIFGHDEVLTAILGDAAGVVLAGMALGTFLAWVFGETFAGLAATLPALRAAAIAPSDALRDG